MSESMTSCGSYGASGNRGTDPTVLALRPTKPVPANTVDAALTAVMSFYRYHAIVGGVPAAHEFYVHVKGGTGTLESRGQYASFLGHVGRARTGESLAGAGTHGPCLRSSPRGRSPSLRTMPPVLTTGHGQVTCVCGCSGPCSRRRAADRRSPAAQTSRLGAGHGDDRRY